MSRGPSTKKHIYSLFDMRPIDIVNPDLEVQIVFDMFLLQECIGLLTLISNNISKCHEKSHKEMLD